MLTFGEGDRTGQVCATLIAAEDIERKIAIGFNINNDTGDFWVYFY